MLVLALGITWILDGLEVTLVGAVSGVLQDQRTLGFTPAEVGFAATCYLIGAVSGSLIFGYLTDRYGRRLFFFVTLSVRSEEHTSELQSQSNLVCRLLLEKKKKKKKTNKY